MVLKKIAPILLLYACLMMCTTVLGNTPFYSSNVSVEIEWTDHPMIADDTALNSFQTKPPKTKKPNFFKRMVLYLFEGKKNKRIRKKFRKVMKTKNLEELGAYIPSPTTDERAYTEYLKNRPVVYHMISGIRKERLAQNRVDSAQVGECYCAALEVIRRNLSKEKESVLLTRMEKYNRKNNDLLGMDRAGGRALWLKEKCNKYRDYLEGENKRYLGERDSLQVKKEKLATILDQLKEKRIKQEAAMQLTRDSIMANDTIIQVTASEWEAETHELSYTISKVPTSNADKRCLKATIEKLSNNQPLTDDCEFIFAEYVKVNHKLNNGKAVDAQRRAISVGFTIGQYCSQDIRDVTYYYLKPLLESIDRVPADYRSKLKINLQISGFADAKPCPEGGCRYVGMETQTYDYKDANNNPKSFSTIKGKAGRMSNEELALSRALCAHQEAKIQLNSYGVKDIKYEFVAEVKGAEGDSLRGVAIAFEIENQFLQYEEKIDRFNEENKKLKRRLDDQQQALEQLEDRIENILRGLSKINLDILETQEIIFEIEEALKKLSLSGLYKKMTDILLARGKSKAEAKKILSQ